MKKFLIIFFILIFSSVKAEQGFHIIVGSNINGIPMQLDNIKKNKKSMLDLKIDNWSFSPKIFSLIQEKSKSSLYNNSGKDIFIKFKIIF